MKNKNIKRDKAKKFTEKRDNYKNYLSASWSWKDIFIELDELKNNEKNFISITSKKYNIKYQTLKNKYNLHCNNKNKSFDTENRGGSNKIFTIEQEKKLFDHIKINYIDKNAHLTNNIIKQLALNQYKQDHNGKTFKISNCWCTKFKKKYKLSTQKIKCSKKAANIPTDEDINNFLTLFNETRKDIKNKHIFNYDETNYNIANRPKTAIRMKGQESNKLKLENNLKEGVTMGLTISASGSFLKPLLIAKGKSNKCLEKYGLTKFIEGTFTQNGWANEDIIILILNRIASITRLEKSILLMDQYKSHTTNKIKDYAKSKNINIIYVPIGMTDTYQPLDVSINGILKAKAGKKYAEFIANNIDKKYTHANCIKDFLIIKKEIKKSTIMKAFDCLKIDPKINMDEN